MIEPDPAESPRPEPPAAAPDLGHPAARAEPAAADEPALAAAAGRRPGAALAAALAVAGLALTVAAAAAWQADRRGRGLLLDLHAAHSPPLGADVGARLRGAPDLDRARLALARALVAHELTPPPAEREPPGDAALGASLARLAIAREQSAAVLARHPASWQAPLLLGISTYLSGALAGDPELVRGWRRWDAPLTLSRDLAPGIDEPHRFSVLAYLELWPVLSEEKRGLTRSLVRRALADWRMFGRIVDLWLTIAETPEEVLAEAPPEVYAWEYLAGRYAQRRDWATVVVALERLDQARETELAERLDGAARRGRSGDVEVARREYFEAVRGARPSHRFLPVLRRALAEAPPGLAGQAEAAALGGWLDWTMELCAVGRCPLEPAEIGRLIGLAGELPPPRAAAAAVLAGDLPEGERLERRAEDPAGGEWGAYWLHKGRDLLRRGHAREAERALARVPAEWRRRGLYAASLRALARTAGDRAAEGEAQALLDDLAHRSWPAEGWNWNGSGAERELVLAGPAALELAMPATAGGAVVRATLDGRDLGHYRVETAATTLRIDAPIGEARVASRGGAGDPALHWLTLETVAGPPVRPGALRAIEGGSR